MTERKRVRKRPPKDAEAPQQGQGTGSPTGPDNAPQGPNNGPTGASVTPAGAATTKVGRPTGTIPSNLKVAFGRGDPWSNVTVDAPFHEKYGNPYGIAAMLMAMEVVESGGRMIWNTGGSGAYGIMQIKEEYWGWLADQLGASLQSREGQIQVAAAILGEYGKGKNPRERFLYSYYPVLDSRGNICLTCRGEDGGTPQQYLDDIDQLVKIINDAAITTPAPEPKPQKKVTEQDVLNLISSNTPGVYISFGYGEANTVNIYHYGKGHMSSAVQGNNIHPGIDIWMPDETPVRAIFAGEVICVGTQGEAVWGQGCGYFSDDNGGIGKISVLTDRSVLVNGKQRRMMMVYGHMSHSDVRPGQMIQDGQRIGRSGHGGNWPHIHLDVGVKAPELNNPAIWNNPGDYHLLNPIPTIIAAYGGEAPIIPVDRVPYDFTNDPNLFVVKATTKVNVHQRGDPSSPVLDTIPAGDTFYATAIIPGNDGKAWWLGVNNGRVPLAGTESEAL